MEPEMMPMAASGKHKLMIRCAGTPISSIAAADDPLRRDANLEHCGVGVEEAKEDIGEQVHGQCADEHDHDSDGEGELQGFIDPVFSPRAVVVGKNGDQAVVEAEYRHEEKALELEVNAEDGGGRRGEGGKDHVHAVGPM